MTNEFQRLFQTLFQCAWVSTLCYLVGTLNVVHSNFCGWGSCRRFEGSGGGGPAQSLTRVRRTWGETIDPGDTDRGRGVGHTPCSGVQVFPAWTEAVPSWTRSVRNTCGRPRPEVSTGRGVSPRSPLPIAEIKEENLVWHNGRGLADGGGCSGTSSELTDLLQFLLVNVRYGWRVPLRFDSWRLDYTSDKSLNSLVSGVLRLPSYWNFLLCFESFRWTPYSGS